MGQDADDEINNVRGFNITYTVYDLTSGNSIVDPPLECLLFKRVHVVLLIQVP